MDVQQPVGRMADDRVLAAFDTTEDPESRGFDAATQARVFAYELVRARHRVGHYRTLYASFTQEGSTYMIENLREEGDTTPAKLVFTDDEGELENLEATGDVVIWTELGLLEALNQELTIQEFFADMLDELVPKLANR